MVTQPDFTRLFYDTFAGGPQPVRYELRSGPNFLHDLVFLSSLIHDARLKREQIKIVDEVLTIPIQRDCWEMSWNERNELHIAQAEIEVRGVQAMRWQGDARRGRELWIDYLYVSEDYRSHEKTSFALLLVGADWRCTCKCSIEEFHLSMSDLETPYLWSERHQSPSS